MRLVLRLCVLAIAVAAGSGAAAPVTVATADPALLKLPLYPGARYDPGLTESWRTVFMPIIRLQGVTYYKQRGVKASVETPAVGVFVTAAAVGDVASFYAKPVGTELRINPFLYAQELRKAIPFVDASLRPTLERAAKKYDRLEGVGAQGEKPLGPGASAAVAVSNPGFNFTTGEPVRRTQIVLYTMRITQVK